MLVNSKEILNNARENKIAIFHFNINNLEWTKYILEECNKLNTPVILGVSESAINYMGGFNVVYSLVSSLIKDLEIKIDVVLHLDHGKSVKSCIKAVDSGFTSVMIDGSKKDFLENIKITKEVVEYAHKKNVVVEAELGIMGEMAKTDIQLGNKTNLQDIIKFVNETKVDSIAPAVGTVHGLYKGELKIDYNLIKEIYDNISIPLVLHGGSALSNEILKKCVNYGITKININSDLQDKWSKAVRQFINKNKLEFDPRKIIASGEYALKSEIDLKMNINN